MAVHAPYNFVPLSRHVQELEWAEFISHDVPFRDGISGELDLTLHVETPLCVGSSRERGAVEPFRTLDGEYAVPGSTLKGMLRNVIEIVSFSKFQLVERDRRYAVRDLRARDRCLYRDHMTRTEAGRGYNAYVPQVQAGWLRKEGRYWAIQPCEIARVEQQDLLDLLRRNGQNDEAHELLGCFRRAGVEPREKYEAWPGQGFPPLLRFDPEPEADHPMSGRPNERLRFRRAGNVGTGETEGRLVFTGQPSPNQRLRRGGRPSGKHREFVFFGGAERHIPVPERVRRDFVLNHSARQTERHGGRDEPNAEWKYLSRHLGEGEAVPVFFRADESGEIDSMGLAFMYRLAYRYGIGDAIDNTSRAHDPGPGARHSRDRPPVDLSEALFGYVRSNASGGGGLAGRATVGLFRLVEGELDARPFSGALLAPRPSFYPAYLAQPAADEEGRLGRAYHHTYMTDRVQVRGWKRYPVRPSANPPEESSAESVTTSWRALRAGSVFRGRIHVHNLRPVELGALVWALDFGGRQKLRHSLGYARPFGFGSVRLDMVEQNLWQLVDGHPVDLKEVRASFASYMDDAVGGKWESTEQLVQLLAMADPGTRPSHELRYMRLSGSEGKNEFEEAKRAGEALPPYVPFSGKSDRERFGEDAYGPRARLSERQARRERSKSRQEQSASVHERVRMQFSAFLEERADEQARKLADEVSREVAVPKSVDPAEWARAFRELFQEALSELRTQAGRASSGEMERIDAEVVEHKGKEPPHRGSKPHKKWERTLKDLEKRRKKVQREEEKAEGRKSRAQAFLEWLDGLERRASE